MVIWWPGQRVLLTARVGGGLQPAVARLFTGDGECEDCGSQIFVARLEGVGIPGLHICRYGASHGFVTGQRRVRLEEILKWENLWRGVAICL